MRPSLRSRSAGRVIAAATAMFVAVSCEENLPSGPETFAAGLRIRVSSDTLVVGESRTAQAEATDAQGHVIQSLSFGWNSADTTILGLPTPTAPTEDQTAGRVKPLLGRRAGRSVLTLSLPDPRFVAAATSRTETVVVGGVRILSAHDSTLTSINDTAVAVAAGLVLVNGALVTRPSQGVRWTHLGTRTTVAGQGDTVRYIARANGADTLIATHDFCLAGAKCADTLIARVSQRLFLTVTPRSFFAWSFSDTLGPTVRLADLRGTGQAGTSVRFIPVTAADSAIVRITPPIGSNNPTTGVVAAPRLVSQGNGSALVRVLGIASDGFTIVATDSVTETVRQVARRVAIEPLRAVMTEIDNIPLNPVARDARGAVIADATVTIASSDIPLSGLSAGPTSDITAPVQGTIAPAISGIALPENNPLAPQIPVTSSSAVITVVPIDSVKAGATTTTVSTSVLDSTGTPAVGEFISFRASGGAAPGAVQVASDGTASVSWTPPDVSGTYTLSGLRPLGALGNEAGRIVIRRSVVVIGGDPHASMSTLSMNATTIATNGTATVTVTVRDVFGNIVTNATPSAFTVTTTRGAVGAFSCSSGVCSATYTAPATAGGDTIAAKINGVDILNSPTTLIIQ